MSELWVLMVVTVFLAWIAQRYAYVNAEYPCQSKYKPLRIPVVLIFLILAVYIGLRRYYNDTDTYRGNYEALFSLPNLWDSFSFSLGDNPGYHVFNSFLCARNVSSQNFLMIYSLITNGLYIVFLAKFSSNLPTSIFLFFTIGAYIFTGAAIKQSIAVAISLAALILFFRKKYVLYIICIMVASTFHPYALMYLLVPFLTFTPWSKWTYILLTGFVISGFILDSLLGTIVDITTMMGEDFSVSSLNEDGVNIFRVIVCNVPTLLTFLFKDQLFKNTTPVENLMVNLAMLNGAIMFVGLFGTANYFARLANYFVMAQAIVLPWIISKLQIDLKRLISFGMIVGYAGYFYYQHGIVQLFEIEFSRMGLWEYIFNYLF